MEKHSLRRCRCWSSARRVRHRCRAGRERARRRGADPRARRQALGQHLAFGRADPGGGNQAAEAAGLLDDTPDLLYQDILAKSHGECDHEIARTSPTRRRTPWSGWSTATNCRCRASWIFQYPGHSRPHIARLALALWRGAADVLVAAVEKEGIPIATSAHVTDLYADRAGRILACACTARWRGRGNRLRRAYPRLQRLRRQQGDAQEIHSRCRRPLLRRHTGNQGDAVRWGEELGASIKDLGSFQGHGAVCAPHGMHLGWGTSPKAAST